MRVFEQHRPHVASGLRIAVVTHWRAIVAAVDRGRARRRLDHAHGDDFDALGGLHARCDLRLLRRELLRGGQVYYLHNDIDTMARTAEDIRKLVPDARVGIAHGQMRERELEAAKVLEVVLAGDERARLVDPVVLGEAQLSLSEAEAALAANAQTSPVLKGKVAAVRSAVAAASTPLPVVITSDGLTEITIKRVARLGTVSSRTVSLRPGQYQFLGSRDGYRDVLVTASINATSDNRIDVRCEEAIIR